jgi:hypothetical protein
MRYKLEAPDVKNKRFSVRPRQVPSDILANEFCEYR